MPSLTLVEHSHGLLSWLREDALPMWWVVGADRVNGGYVESIGLDGRATQATRRARVQPRQVYSYVEGGRLAWRGDWQTAVHHGIDYFDDVFLCENGTYGAVASPEGALLDDTFDLYNQAFAIFAFAQMASAFPAQAGVFAERAERLLSVISATFTHPVAGFEEANPRRLPLCSNPHMHLFEAAQAWEAIRGRGIGPWSALADEIASLAMSKFIDRRTGALREFFDADWSPYPGEKGRVVEPGHQFEWAWLLARWSSSRGSREALAKARRLFDIGVYYGICPERRVAVMTLDDDFTVRDNTARLWPQTEWLKAAIRLADESTGMDRHFYLGSAREACSALGRYLDVPIQGLWRDKMNPDGSFIDEPAPASSFYHVVCAISELEAFVGRGEKTQLQREIAAA